MNNQLLINLNDEKFYEPLLEIAQFRHHPPIDNQVTLLLDISHNTDLLYKTIICTTQAEIYKSSKNIQELFCELQYYHGLSYSNCAEWALIYSNKQKKIPYIINGCLYFPIKNPSTDFKHWIAYHHQISSPNKNTTAQTILHFNRFDVLLPITYKTFQHNIKDYEHLVHESRQLCYNLREFIERSDCDNEEKIYFSSEANYSFSKLFELGTTISLNYLTPVTQNQQPIFEVTDKIKTLFDVHAWKPNK